MNQYKKQPLVAFEKSLSIFQTTTENQEATVAIKICTQ
jgi:hypothetical protein